MVRVSAGLIGPPAYQSELLMEAAASNRATRGALSRRAILLSEITAQS